MPSVILGNPGHLKGVGMAETKKKKGVYLPKKTYWHLYSLQNVQTEKLVGVVNKILKREYVLIK